MPFKVLTAQFSHETNTFSRFRTDLAAFRRRSFHRENEIPGIYKGTRSALGASFEAAAKYGWTLIHPIHASANPAGLVTDEAFETVTDAILERLDSSVDGILLHLHGAMVTESHEDGEGALLQRIRRRVGDRIPIVVTLDLHGNITEAMARHANALIAFRTYPHIDAYERAWQAADLLQRALKGEIKPKTVIAKRPMLWGLDWGRTQGGPMLELIRRGEAIEARGEALVVSICAGFPPADIRDVGPSVTVTGDGDDPRFQSIAEDFMDYAWRHRGYTSIDLRPIAEVVAKAKAGEGAKQKPLVVADYTDNPGGGGYGDSTAVLKAMVEADLQNAVFHAICDPEAVDAGKAAGIGRRTTIKLGGKGDPRLGGGPLGLTGEVACLTDGKFVCWGPMGGGVPRDYGHSMVFRVGGVEVIVISNNGQATDLAQLTSMGIDPTRKDTILVKSMQHFRAAFQPIAREVVLVDSGSLCSESYSPEMYKKVRRPIWPIDNIEK
jgi:microcystin degradation protein MlrC